MQRPISVAEAAKILKITRVGVLKRISRGQILAVPLSGKGLLVCRESVEGEDCTPEAFSKACRRWISVPQACDIVCVTDAMIGRMLVDGRLKGFRLNTKAWAVDRESCERNIRDYLADPPTHGRPRLIGESRAPAKKPKGRSRKKKS